MRPLFGLFTALSTAVMIIIMAQMINQTMHPYPMDLGLDHDTLTKWLEIQPNRYYWIIAISHTIGAFSAGLIASLVSGSNRIFFGIVAMLCVFVPVLGYLFSYYFPLWFVITDTLATAIVGFVGVTVGSGRFVS